MWLELSEGFDSTGGQEQTCAVSSFLISVVKQLGHCLLCVTFDKCTSELHAVKTVVSKRKQMRCHMHVCRKRSTYTVPGGAAI